jgi:hypothetical protein
LSVLSKRRDRSLFPRTKLDLTVNMSSNKRPPQEADLYDFLKTIDTVLRETLEDSVACIDSDCRWFEHLSEPDQIELVLQRMVTEGQNMTAEHLKSYIDTVISRANWEMCQKLHQTEIALHEGLVSLRKPLSTRPFNPRNLKEYIKKSDMITHELNNFHKSIVVDNMYTKAQQALINGQDELNFNKFVQDSIDKAFQDDPRALLGLHSASMFLNGIKKAAINMKYTLFAKEVGSILSEELKVWGREVLASHQQLQLLKKPRKS